MHEHINRAALRLIEMGRVHALGCMSGGPSWSVDSVLLRALQPSRVDIGLHLSLTELTLNPALARPLPALIRASYLRRLDPALLRREIVAQLDVFEAGVGRPPAYVDGHQHVHQLPQVRETLLAELARRYPGCLPWLRSTRRSGAVRRRIDGLGLGSRLKPWVIESLGAGSLQALARRAGFGQNRHLLGVYDFEGGPQGYGRLLSAWLEMASQGDLLMCHPSAAPAGDDTLHPGDPLLAARVAEFQVLSEPALAAQLREARIRLCPMHQILARRAGAWRGPA